MFNLIIAFITAFIFRYLLVKFLNKSKNLVLNKPYSGIKGRCWVCGELMGSFNYCDGPRCHSRDQKINQLNHLKSLGYNCNLPNID